MNPEPLDLRSLLETYRKSYRVSTGMAWGMAAGSHTVVSGLSSVVSVRSGSVGSVGPFTCEMPWWCGVLTWVYREVDGQLIWGGAHDGMGGQMISDGEGHMMEW